MADTNLRARSISEIVDAAFALYKQNAMQYIVMMAIAYAPVLLINLTLVGGKAPTTLPDVIKVLPGAIVRIFATSIIGAMIARLGSAAYLGNDFDVAQALRAVLPKLPTLIIATILFYIIVIFSAIFLVIPAIYFALRFFATSQAIVLENKGALAAFSRSGVLSKGNKMHIFATTLLTWGIYLLLSVGVSSLAKMLGGLILQQIVGSVIAVFAYPVLSLVSMVLYYDTRIRVEGFDVEHMSQSLGGAPPFTPMNPSVA